MSESQDPLDRDMSFVFDDQTKWKQLSELFPFALKDKTTKYQKIIREALLKCLLKKAS